MEIILLFYLLIAQSKLDDQKEKKTIDKTKLSQVAF
jgi:hypothetical protein